MRAKRTGVRARRALRIRNKSLVSRSSLKDRRGTLVENSKSANRVIKDKTRFVRNQDENLAALSSFFGDLGNSVKKNTCCLKRKSRKKAMFSLGIAGKIKIKFAKWTTCSRTGC